MFRNWEMMKVEKQHYEGVKKFSLECKYLCIKVRFSCQTCLNQTKKPLEKMNSFIDRFGSESARSVSNLSWTTIEEKMKFKISWLYAPFGSSENWQVHVYSQTIKQKCWAIKHDNNFGHWGTMSRFHFNMLTGVEGAVLPYSAILLSKLLQPSPNSWIHSWVVYLGPWCIRYKNCCLYFVFLWSCPGVHNGRGSPVQGPVVIVNISELNFCKTGNL